jgi:hypothetical protein
MELGQRAHPAASIRPCGATARSQDRNRAQYYGPHMCLHGRHGGRGAAGRQRTGPKLGPKVIDLSRVRSTHCSDDGGHGLNDGGRCGSGHHMCRADTCIGT